MTRAWISPAELGRLRTEWNNTTKGRIVSRLQSFFGTGLVITDGAWGTEFQKRGLEVGYPVRSLEPDASG